MKLRMLPLALIASLPVVWVSAETIEQLQQRLKMGSGTAAPARGADMVLVEKPWEKITDQQLFDAGGIAMGKDPKAWHHAETDHFVIHFHRRTDAQKVMRQAEFYYQQVKTDLKVAEDHYDRKNQIFVFEREPEWKGFIADAKMNEWAAGISCRSELFFLSRQADEFAAGTLAHETTHCIFHRFVNKPIPLWLNEGFAEFESGNAYAKFKGIGGGSHGSGHGGAASFPLKELLSATSYPPKEEAEKIHSFYRTSEKVVRFMMTKLDRKDFLPFVLKMASGAKFEDALIEAYAGQLKNYDDFLHRYEKFN